MQGRVQVRTRSQFKPALSTDDSNSNSSSKADGSSKSAHGGSSGTSGTAEGSSGAAGASEADLRALFDSIDVDGSGALRLAWRQQCGSCKALMYGISCDSSSSGVGKSLRLQYPMRNGLSLSGKCLQCRRSPPAAGV